jgi:hypothetical protein
MNHHEETIAQAMGEDKSQPHVMFFDHAVFSKDLTEKSGRPRYIEKAYIRKIPSAPDLIVRDVFDAPANDEHKRQFPEQWAAYLARKSELDMYTPPIEALPTMTVARKAELHALKIRNCRDLIDYQGDLDELEPLRDVAKKIMGIANGLRNRREVSEEREVVQNGADRQPHYSPRPVQSAPQGGKEESFTYSFRVA